MPALNTADCKAPATRAGPMPGTGRPALVLEAKRRTAPLRASIVEPTGICTSGPSGTNVLVPGSFTRTFPETSETLTLSSGSGGSGGSHASPTSFWFTSS